jgi:hypothetical protein
MEADPEHVRRWSRDYRARLREQSLTIKQLRVRARVDHPLADLRSVLRQEVRAGRVQLVQGRYYRLNGGLPGDVVRALRQL